MEDPKVVVNQNPVMKYEIALRVAGSPQAIAPSQAFANFIVENEQCVPMKPVSGVKVAPTKSVSIPLKEISAGIFKGEIYLDQFRDEDYYNLGVCHWSIVAITSVFSIGKASLVTSINRDEILAGKDVVKYFPTDVFELGDQELSLPGNPAAADYPDPTQTFAISAVAREARK